jgi:hypothetical protein
MLGYRTVLIVAYHWEELSISVNANSIWIQESYNNVVTVPRVYDTMHCARRTEVEMLRQTRYRIADLLWIRRLGVRNLGTFPL